MHVCFSRVVDSNNDEKRAQRGAQYASYATTSHAGVVVLTRPSGSRSWLDLDVALFLRQLHPRRSAADGCSPESAEQALGKCQGIRLVAV